MTDRAEELRARLVRNIHDVPLESFERPPLYASRGAMLGLGTAAAKLGASFDIVPPGKRACPYHLLHAQEEMFVILEGSGTLRVAGEMVPVKAGDVIFTPAGPDHPHQLINTSESDLKYLSISTKETPEVCEYPDSGKYNTFARHGERVFRATQKSDASLDYWHDEP